MFEHRSRSSSGTGCCNFKAFSRNIQSILKCANSDIFLFLGTRKFHWILLHCWQTNMADLCICCFVIGLSMILTCLFVLQIGTMVIGRSSRLTHFLEWREYKIVFKREVRSNSSIRVTFIHGHLPALVHLKEINESISSYLFENTLKICIGTRLYTLWPALRRKTMN